MKETAVFTENANNIIELRENAIYYKDKALYYIIEKIITLPLSKWNDFKNNVSDEYEFIPINKEFMYIDEGDVFHCLGVKTDNNNFGMIIGNSDGEDFFKYSSFIKL